MIKNLAIKKKIYLAKMKLNKFEVFKINIK